MEKFDPRVDSLVMETKTLWDSTVGTLSEEDRKWVAAAIHRQPQLASNVSYERCHTGFTRIIKVSLDDIQRLYMSRT